MNMCGLSLFLAVGLLIAQLLFHFGLLSRSFLPCFLCWSFAFPSPFRDTVTSRRDRGTDELPRSRLADLSSGCFSSVCVHASALSHSAHSSGLEASASLRMDPHRLVSLPPVRPLLCLHLCSLHTVWCSCSFANIFCL